MMAIKKRTVALLADRLSNQWVVRDPDGDFWIVPFGANGWDQRRPFELSEASKLEPIPRNCIYLLDLRF